MKHLFKGHKKVENPALFRITIDRPPPFILPAYKRVLLTLGLNRNLHFCIRKLNYSGTLFGDAFHFNCYTHINIVIIYFLLFCLLRERWSFIRGSTIILTNSFLKNQIKRERVQMHYKK
jgi:hypothetical protein